MAITGFAKIAVPQKHRKPYSVQTSLRRAFRPLAIELAWIAYEWNALHSHLADLFADISTADRDMSFAIWHSIPNDRTQRDILKAALTALHPYDDHMPRLRDDTAWVLEKLDALAGKRNGAIHVPLAFMMPTGATEIDISTYYFHGNPHAIQLKDKPLVDEFRWYRDHLSRLCAYAADLHSVLTFGDDGFPWPDRPQLPSRGQFASRKSRHRKNGSK